MNYSFGRFLEIVWIQYLSYTVYQEGKRIIIHRLSTSYAGIRAPNTDKISMYKHKKRPTIEVVSFGETAPLAVEKIYHIHFLLMSFLHLAF